MSSVQIQVLNPSSVKTGHSQQKNPVRPTNPSTSKKKNKYDRSCRKRSKSFSGCGIINQKPVLPSKFLLGGNIKDPLNLNSLQDEEINRAMNAVTPKSSPVPTPPRKKGQLEVIIPKNIHDPLNLIDCDDDAEYEQQLCSPVKKSKKKRLKKRRTISGTLELTDVTADVVSTTEAKTPESSADSAKIPEIPETCLSPNEPASEMRPNVNLTLNIAPAAVASAAAADGTGTAETETALPAAIKKEKTKRKSDEHGHHGLKKFKNNSMDKIVSPVVPQPGAWLKRSNSAVKWPKPRHNKQQDTATPQFKERDKRFQYGNYNRYYGYRNPHNETDYRLKVFSHHPYLFVNKDILDVGCNIGHVTLSIARDFHAKSVLGVDIDQKLISIARKNVKHYVKKGGIDEEKEKEDVVHLALRKTENCEFFPISMPILYGDIDVPGFTHDKSGGFPNNVTFKQCNYILEDDNLLALEQPQFDVILCLSVTKWFHLNWGDAGLKQAFRRMYAQLRPGGKLILEPQNWSSYKSKKKLTSTIYDNYNSIEFFPEKFREYLLSPAVGFAKGEILGFPVHQFKGFRRPIQVFTKSTMFPSERTEATPLNADSSSYRRKTEKYEGHSQGPCIEHVYTDIFDGRYCGCADDNQEINEKLGEELKKFRGAATTAVAKDEGNSCGASLEMDVEKKDRQDNT
ncbi:7SK snRNA methylphosphate capping enzyme bin3-like isoform X1 [Diorhabda sublineata]|uniref:7SK snRNA methylphosphate capping enzyme bin3-like isoform X1 n=1 Tax=Diorhabda sublineata TaxID=1163346 RepID=UPI0024E0B7EC|nr:7SK snRNA methylphosphate capping enzyme bin3-like isoform X1 [Diorhabda sublineata]